MTPFQSLIYIVCAVILFGIIVTKIQKKKGGPDYRKKIDALKSRAQEDLKGKYSDAVEIYPFLSDTCQVYLICRDRNKDLMSVVTEDKTFIMKIKDENECEILVNHIEKKAFDSVTCRIKSPSLSDALDVVLASQKHNVKSYLGKSILENADFFRNKLLDLN